MLHTFNFYAENEVFFTCGIANFGNRAWKLPGGTSKVGNRAGNVPGGTSKVGNRAWKVSGGNSKVGNRARKVPGGISKVGNRAKTFRVTSKWYVAKMINIEKKEKYELVIALVAIVISLSSFKDELKSIGIDLGFYTLTLANYFLFLILIFVFALHLYAIPIFFGNTFLSKLKIIRFFEIIAYFLFSFALISPTLLFIVYLLNYTISTFSTFPLETLTILKNILGVVSFVLAAAFTAYKGYLQYQTNREKLLQELEDKKIKDLELAQRLFSDGYYSQSILESYKVIENYFRSILVDKQDISPRARNYDILNLADKIGLVEKEQKEMINRVREMRNSAAHLNAKFTKEEAEFAISTVKKLLM